MVELQLARRGIRDPAILEALAEVPREEFLPPDLVEFAYEDSPLPIGEGQTISQPFVVALMAQALELEPGDRVLEVGAGSGYAAAVLSRLSDEVFTVERLGSLAESARERLRTLGFANVHVLHGDGTQGWPEHAPYDAVVVAAGGPEVPAPLLEQLSPGGRLVIPVGETQRLQELVRVRRKPDGTLEREDLGAVQFVPLVGEAGWPEDEHRPRLGTGAPRSPQRPPSPEGIPRPGTEPAPPASAPATGPERIAAAAEPFDSVDDADLDALLERIGDSRVVLLGEATHGTSEFYRLRARITRALAERKGFRIVALEADWPDAARIDHYVRDLPGAPPEAPPFQRFPTWMWANEEFLELVHSLRRFNEGQASPDPSAAAGIYGLDLYSLHASIAAVVRYLDDVDPEAARVARERYGCLSPWEADPATYGRAALSGRYRECEEDVVAMLGDLLDRHMRYASQDGHRFLDAVQNARLIAAAERYYRIMYYGGRESWNLRDRHMFETLQALLDFRGDDARAVVWAHNSHVGDARATEMGARGEHNLGQLCRAELGGGVYVLGFGTDHGTVAAASDWGGDMQVMDVRPADARSYERLCHESGVDNFFLPLGGEGSGAANRQRLRDDLMDPRLERAIGVIYRPRTELASHYFQALLPEQFDEYVWIDETRAVNPLGREAREAAPDTFPFGL